ncbi:hypothetical protein LZ32DRAFT_1242 [Colletotrichum eremochloae]|nr:hypothetical protein LZ32DRAFT_1242 [Colletotrichum eremochloae]
MDHRRHCTVVLFSTGSLSRYLFGTWSGADPEASLKLHNARPPACPPTSRQGRREFQGCTMPGLGREWQPGY